MLTKELDRENVVADQKHTSLLRSDSLWALIFSLALIALFPPSAAAQTSSSAAPAAAPVTLFGSGVQTPLRFAGESAADNQVSLSMGASFFYDDNVLSNNADRLSDEAIAFTSHLGAARQTENLTFSFDYTPYFPIYTHLDQFDRLNHLAALNMAYRLSSHLSVGVFDTISYQNGFNASISEQPITTGLGLPTALNQTISPYTIRTLANSSGLNLTYVMSKRMSLTFTGTYEERKFGSQSEANQPLYNSNGGSGGVEFQDRVTEHTSIGILVLHQDTTYQGGDIFGSRVRAQIESALFSVGSRLAPTVTLTVYGGPQYVHLLGLGASEAGISQQWQPTGGASITKEVRKTALDLSFQRAVSDGGGLYTSVINTNVTFGVRRRLAGKWEASLHGGGGEADASLFQLANGKTEALLGGIDFSRPVRGGSLLHISYDTTHQVSKGTLPISSDYDRNQVSIGFDFGVKALPWGR